MVQFICNVLTNKLTKPFGVKNKTGIRVWASFNRYEQLIVVPMPVIIGALAKDLLIFLPAPGRVIEFMGCVKMLDTGQIHHLFLKICRKGNAYRLRLQAAYICFMFRHHILLVAATSIEIQPTLDFLSNNEFLLNDIKVNILVTGVGIMNTTHGVTNTLNHTPPFYHYCIQAGIGGSFSTDHPPGSLVFVKEQLIGDLGVEENNEFKDVFDLGLQRPSAQHYDQKIMVNFNQQDWQNYNVPFVRGITINEITTRASRIQQLKQKYQPVVESMEGAAFHYSCMAASKPFIELRAISNYVGERDKSKWKMKEAIEALNKKLLEMLRRDWDSNTWLHYKK